MKTMRLFIFCILMFALTPFSYAENDKVYAKSGNIFYTQDNGQNIQISQSGKDSTPVLSPNMKKIAFARTTDKIVPNDCFNTNTKTKYATQIWIYDIEKKHEHLLVKTNFECKDPKKQIIDPTNLAFSPDSKILYFLTSAWVTSGALHAVTLDNGKEYYIAPANSLEVVNKGHYKGNLIVNQHRYFIGGGSYDWYWLIMPNGKEEGPIGEEISNDQKESIESES